MQLIQAVTKILVPKTLSPKTLSPGSITKYMCTEIIKGGIKGIKKGIAGLLILCLSQILVQTSYADDNNNIEKNRLRGSFTLLVSLAPLLGESWQYTHASLLPNEPTSESGYGFTFDFGDGSGNAFALDYYNIYEEASRRSISSDTSSFESLQLQGPLLGYRYHYPMGLYTGLGFWYPTTQVKLNRDLTRTYQPEIVSVLNLGFNSVLKSGFTIGAHLIHSLPVTLELDRDKLAEGDEIVGSGELKGVQVTSVYFKLGYSW